MILDKLKYVNKFYIVRTPLPCRLCKRKDFDQEQRYKKNQRSSHAEQG